MAPPLLSSTTISISSAPLLPETFQPYGAAITSPLPRDLTAHPSTHSSFPSLYSNPISANQGSAVKYNSISPITESYGTCGSQKKGSPHMSMFSCFPRQLRNVSSADNSSTPSSNNNNNISGLFDVKFLERHPYTSQTFIPLSSSQSPASGLTSKSRNGVKEDADDADEAVYLVIVAPSLVGQSAECKSVGGNGVESTVVVRDPPDMSNLRAFIAAPGQAVTYAAGTWHAPMVVLGKRRIDFVVFQFTNGIEEEDCQLVGLRDGIVVDVNAGLGRSLHRAKL